MATENLTSKTQSQILLAAKLRELENVLKKIRNQKQTKNRNLVRALRLEVVRLEGIEPYLVFLHFGIG